MTDKCNNCSVELNTCENCGAPACYAEVCGTELGHCMAEPSRCKKNQLLWALREMHEWVDRFFANPTGDVAELLRLHGRRVVKLTREAKLQPRRMTCGTKVQEDGSVVHCGLEARHAPPCVGSVTTI